MCRILKSKLSFLSKDDLISNYSVKIEEDSPIRFQGETTQQAKDRTKVNVYLKFNFLNEELNFDLDNDIIRNIIKDLQLNKYYQIRLNISIIATNTYFKNISLSSIDNKENKKPHEGIFISGEIDLKKCRLKLVTIENNFKYSLDDIICEEITTGSITESFNANNVKSGLISLQRVNNTPSINNFILEKLSVIKSSQKIILTNGTIKSEIIIQASKYTNGKNDFPMFQISFVQLKNAIKTKIENIRKIKKQLESTGNDFDYLNIRACEFKIMKNEISFWKKPTDFIQLTLNEISNNFGTSWWRGVVFTITINFIGSLALFYSILSKNKITSFKENSELLKSIFFNNFSPIYKNDLLDNHNSTSLSSYIILFLVKVFIFYGIYQTVSAFRKYKK